MSQWFRSYGFAEVADGLLIGAYPLDDRDVAMLSRLHVDRVLNTVQDDEYPDGSREAVVAALTAAGIVEERLGLADYGHLPAPAIDSAIQTAGDWLDQGLHVYLHCRAGWQRSAALAAALIASREGIGLEEAMAQVQRRKPSADPLPHQREDLERWWQARAGAEQ